MSRSTTIGNDNAKLVRYLRDPQKGVIVELVREWDHMDARTSKTSVDSMSTSGPVYDPQASSLTYSGTWYRAKPINAVESDMRGVVVTETLVPSVGASTTYSWAVNCSETRSVRLEEDLTATSLATLEAEYASSTQGHYYLIDVDRNEKGLYNARVTDRIAVSHTQAPFTSRTSNDETELTERRFNQTTGTGWTDQSQGVIVSLDSQKNETCTYDNTERATTSIERSLTAHTSMTSAGTREDRSKTYNDRQVPSVGTASDGIISSVRGELQPDGTYTNEAMSRTSAAITKSGTANAAGYTEAVSTTHNARSIPDVGGGTDGIIDTIDATPNDDGSSNVRHSSRTSIEIEAVGNASASGYTESRTNTKSTTTIPSATAGVGIIETVDATPNDDGTNDVRVVSRTSAEISATGNVDTEGFTEARSTTRNTTSIPTASGGSGVIETVDATPNDDGTNDVRVTSRTSISQSAAGSEAAEGHTLAAVNYKNQAVAVSAPGISVGIVSSADNRKNDDGTFDARTTSRTAIEQESYGNATATGFTESTTHVKSTLTEKTAAGSGGGIIERADNRKNDDGTLDADITSRTSAAMEAEGSSAAALENTSSTRYRNAASAISIPAGAATGIVTEATSSPNDDGTFDGTAQSTTSTAVGYAESTTAAGLHVAISKTKNARTEATVSDPTTGVVEIARNSILRDGSFDTEHVTQTSQTQSVSATFGSALHDTSRTTLNNQAAAPTATYGSGVVTSISPSNNVDGSVDASVVSTSALEVFSDPYTSQITLGSTASSTLFAGASTIPGIGSTTRGSISPHMNEDGTYSGIITAWNDASSWVLEESSTKSITSWIYHHTGGMSQKREVYKSRMAKSFSNWKDAFDYIETAKTDGSPEMTSITGLGNDRWLGIVETITGWGAAWEAI